MNYLKRVRKWHVLLVAFLIGVIVIGISGEIKAYKVDITVPIHKEKLKEYSNIKGYIIEQAEKNNLDPMDIISIIVCESRFNPNAVGVNENKTADLGLIQVNTIHVKSGSITLKCASDERCSIDWLIKKRLKDGDYSAWSCSRKIGLK